MPILRATVLSLSLAAFVLAGAPGARADDLDLDAGLEDFEDDFGDVAASGVPGPGDGLDDDPFGGEDLTPAPVPALPAGAGAEAGLALGPGHVDAFADLLEERREKGDPVPFHALARLRLSRWAAGGGPGSSPAGRLQALVAAAGDPTRPLPRAGTDPGAPVDTDPDPFGEDPEFPDLGTGLAPELDLELDEVPDDFPDPFSTAGAAPAAAPHPFLPRKLQDEVCAQAATPTDLAGWRALIAASPPRDSLQDGFGELVGTGAGRSLLAGLVEGALPGGVVEAMAEAIGDHGGDEDEALLDALGARHPGARASVEQARGRVIERRRMLEDLDLAGRRRWSAQLAQQAAHRLAKDDVREAVRLYAQARHADGRPAAWAYELADACIRIGFLVKAREALEQALAAGSRAPGIVTGYVRVLRHLGDKATRVSFLERVFAEGGPTELKVKVANELAYEAVADGDGAEALRLAEIASHYFMAEDIRDNVLARRGEALLLLGRRAEARAAFAAAHRLDPTYRKARLGLELASARP